MMIAAGALLAGCRGAGHDADGLEPGASVTQVAAALPIPQATRGGVTGMPDLPGPGAIGAADATSSPQMDDLMDRAGDPVAAPDGYDDIVSVLDGAAPAFALPDPPAQPVEPGEQEAVAVVRHYHEAIDSGSFARAYRSWSEDGAATGQSPQQFADSFAGTAAQSVEYMTPGRIEAAAGSRYIEVPVMIQETRRDGGVRRYAGAYTLRRAAADGASAEQRAWRIVSADLREVRP